MLIGRVADPCPSYPFPDFKILSEPNLRLMLIGRVADPGPSYPDPFVKIWSDPDP